MFIKPIELSTFKAAGKDMFAKVAEKDWQRYYPCPEKELCTWALRSLYINEGPVSLLIDCGFGNINPHMLQEYQVHNFKNVREFLVPIDVFPVTHVLLTHLHLDHCGGLLYMQQAEMKNVFPGARIIAGKEQLNAAQNPSDFESSSFQKELVTEIASTTKLKLIENECFIFPWLEVLLYNGHTQGMMLPVIHHNDFSLAFVGDLIPSLAHLILDATMEYDVNPVLTLAERQEFLKEAYENEYLLFFQHDIYIECCSLKKENGKIVPDKVLKAEEIF